MRRSTLPLALLLIGLAKLALVSGNEIITEGSDSVGYLLFAHDWFWGYPVSPSRGPGYPLWVAGAHAVGVPLRVATELALVAAAVAFSLSLKRLRVPDLLGATVCAVVLFHPATISNLDMPMSEGLFFILLLFNLAATVAVLTENRSRSAIVLSGLVGLTQAGLLHTRVADNILLSGTAVFATLGMIAVSVARIGLGKGLWLGFRCFIAGSAMVLGINLTVFSLNQKYYGHFGYNKIVDLTQERLLRVLMKIDPGRPTPHPYIVVQTGARQLAYAASPTFASFQSLIEDAFRPRIEASGQGGASRTGISGEMDFSDMVGLMPTLEQNFGEPALIRASDELETALANGRIPSRLTFGLIVPDAATFGAVSTQITKTVRRLVKVDRGPVMDDFPFYGTLFAPLYDGMAGRRQRLLRKGPLTMVITLPEAMIPIRVHLLSNAIGFFERQGQGNPFQNTLKELEERGYSPYADLGTGTVRRLQVAPQGFRDADVIRHRFYAVSIPPVRDRASLFFLKLAIGMADGRTVEIPDLEARRVVDGKIPGTGEAFAYRVDGFPLRLSSAHRLAYAMQQTLFRQFDAYAGYGALALAVASLAGLVASSRRRQRGDVVKGDVTARTRDICVCGMLGSIVVGRVVFYAAVDAALFPISTERHIFPAMALLFPWLLVCGAVSLRAVAGIARRGETATEPPRTAAHL